MYLILIELPEVIISLLDFIFFPGVPDYLQTPKLNLLLFIMDVKLFCFPKKKIA